MLFHRTVFQQKRPNFRQGVEGVVGNVRLAIYRPYPPQAFFRQRETRLIYDGDISLLRYVEIFFESTARRLKSCASFTLHEKKKKNIGVQAQSCVSSRIEFGNFVDGKERCRPLLGGGREGGEAVGAKRERKKREAIGLTIPKRLDGVII